MQPDPYVVYVKELLSVVTETPPRPKISGDTLNNIMRANDIAQAQIKAKQRMLNKTRCQ